MCISVRVCVREREDINKVYFTDLAIFLWLCYSWQITYRSVTDGQDISAMFGLCNEHHYAYANQWEAMLLQDINDGLELKFPNFKWKK